MKAPATGSMPEDGRRFALVVCTSKYDDANLSLLKAPRKDAAALAAVLKKPNIGGFSTTMLADRPAHVVLQAVDRFFAGRSEDDTLLLYFSGHGLKDDAGGLYVAARDTTRDLLLSTAVSDGFLRDVMARSRAGRQVLILDCCFGGAFNRALMSGKGADVIDASERFEGTGRVIMTASNATQFAYERDGVAGEPPLSVFTKIVVQGLRTGDADVDGDEQVSVQDLYMFAYKRVAFPGSNQTPTISKIGQEGEIVLAKVPVGRTRSKLSPVPASDGKAPGRETDLSPWVRVRDTGTDRTNLAVAAVTALETAMAFAGAHVSLSARYVHEKACQLGGEENAEVTMDRLTGILQEFGAPEERLWPYRPGESKLPQGTTWAKLDAAAATYRARMLPITNPDDIVHNLGLGRPVLAVFPVFRSTWLVTPSRPGWIEAPRGNEQPMGRAAVTIVRLDQAGGVLHFAHTWGEAWGDRGFGSMSLDTAQQLFADDAMWAVAPRSRFRWETSAASQVVRRPPARRKPKRMTRTYPGLRRSIYDAKGAGNWSPDERSLVRAEGSEPTGDKVVDDVYDAMEAFYAFFFEVYGRDSVDGKGAPLEAVVHYGRDFSNTFWDGQRLVVGDGDGKIFVTFTSVETVAHELTHAVIQHETPLVYRDQPGALNESLADIFGVMVQQRRLGHTVEEADWVIGRNMLHPSLKAAGIRSLAAPGTAYDNSVLGKDRQVDHMSRYVKTTLDNGGIFVNSGIPNRAFYLAATALGGHSWERAGAVWYDVMVGRKLTAKASFHRFAELTVESAEQRYGDGSEEARRIGEAWLHVGVLGGPRETEGKRGSRARVSATAAAAPASGSP